MSAPPASAEHPTTQPGWARPMLVRHLDILTRLTEAAVDIADVITSEVSALKADPDTSAADRAVTLERLSRAHARVARAARLGILLQNKLIKGLESWDNVRETCAVTDAWEAERARAAVIDSRKESIGRIVERINGDAVETAAGVLIRDALERLDHDDLYGDIATRPVSELIATLCKDLGLDPDWPSLAEEAWEQSELAADQPGWPLSAFAPAAGVRPGLSP